MWAREFSSNEYLLPLTLTVKGSQLLQPLFEYSGACAGCGETPYVKLLSQLFGDRALIANATGCSSIYGGNLPTTPWAVDENGRGPTWSNSLFEDNAEFGLGFRLTVDKQTEYARELVNRLRSILGDELADELLDAEQVSEADIAAQRARDSTYCRSSLRPVYWASTGNMMPFDRLPLWARASAEPPVLDS